jgi:hypothetical protein
MKLKQKILILLAASFYFTSYHAQFNNAYLTEFNGEALGVEVNEEDGSYLIPVVYGTDNLDPVFVVMRVSPDGTLEGLTNIFDFDNSIYSGAHNSFIQTEDGGYLLAAGYNGPFVIKYDSELQIQWQQFDNSGGYTHYWGGGELGNGDFVLGMTSPGESYNILPMRRYSAQGELLSEFEIELNYDFVLPNSFAVKDSFVYVAFHHIWLDGRRNYLACYNAISGEEIWEINQIEDDEVLAFTDPILCWDQYGRLLYTYHEMTQIPLPGVYYTGYYGSIKVVALNPESGELTEELFVSPSWLQVWIWDAEVTDDGGMVIMYQGYPEIPPNFYGPRVIKLDVDYQTEWNNIFSPPEEYFNPPEGSYWLSDIEITPDDCIISSGYSQAFNDDTGVFQLPWVLKIDACGNEIVTDCSLSGLSELSGRNKISIYPNPARNRVFLKAENAIQHAMIFDMNGKMVHDEIFSGAQEQTLFIDHLPQGLYLVTAIDNKGVRSSSKVVVEK